MRIAIVDDGINHGGSSVLELYECHNGKIRSCRAHITTRITHADICAKIIKSDTVEFVSINIFNDNSGATTPQKMQKALKLCLRLKIDIVHMSIGSFRWIDGRYLLSIVNKLNENGIIVVASVSPLGYMTYPASLPNVIGVCVSPIENMKNILPCAYNSQGIDYFVKPPEKVSIDQSITSSIPNTSSFAAAQFTSLLADSTQFASNKCFSKYSICNKNDCLYLGAQNTDVIVCYRHAKPYIHKRYVYFKGKITIVKDEGDNLLAHIEKLGIKHKRSWIVILCETIDHANYVFDLLSQCVITTKFRISVPFSNNPIKSSSQSNETIPLLRTMDVQRIISSSNRKKEIQAMSNITDLFGLLKRIPEANVVSPHPFCMLYGFNIVDEKHIGKFYQHDNSTTIVYRSS